MTEPRLRIEVRPMTTGWPHNRWRWAVSCADKPWRIHESGFALNERRAHTAARLAGRRVFRELNQPEPSTQIVTLEDL